MPSGRSQRRIRLGPLLMAALAWMTPAVQSGAMPAERGQLAADDQRGAETSSGLAATDADVSSLDDFAVVRTVTVNFGKGKYEVSRSQRAQLQQLIAQAQSAQDYIISVTAYAPPVGSDPTDQKLSMLRASAITAILRQAAVPLANVIVSAARDISQQVSHSTTSKAQADDPRAVVTLFQKH